MRSCYVSRVLVLFLLFSLSFWFIGMPDPVLADGTTNYFLDFEDGYVNGDQASETWVYSWQSGGDYCKVDTTIAYSGSYSYKTTHDGAYGIFHFNNTDFDSLSFRINVQGGSTWKNLNVQFINMTGNSMLEGRIETKADDTKSYIECDAWDGSTAFSVGGIAFPKTDFARVCFTKLTETTWNFSVYDEDNIFISGRDNGQIDTWINWNGTVQFQSRGNNVYLDDFSYNGGSGGVGNADGNTTINVYNESSGLAISGWNLKIKDEYGGVYYSQNGLSNPVSIDHSVYGTGETYFQFGAANYSNRTYYADIENGINYVLDAYLPYVDLSHLYYVKVVNGYDDNIRDAEIHISQTVGSDLVEVASGFTNSYGAFATNLISDTEYYINISHSDYDDLVLDSLYTDPVYYGSNYPIVYVMSFTSIDYDNESDWQDEIGFTGYLSGDTLYVNYSDSSTNTVNTSLIVYEINGSSYNQIGWDNRTSDNSFQYSQSGVNSSNCYEVHLFLNHSDYGYMALYLIICPDTRDYRDLTNKSFWDDLFDLNYGSNPFGWSNCFAFFIMTMTLFSFSSRNSGIGIVLTGFLLLFVNMIIGFHIMGVTIPVLFILFGFLSQWGIHRREWS